MSPRNIAAIAALLAGCTTAAPLAPAPAPDLIAPRPAPAASLTPAPPHWTTAQLPVTTNVIHGTLVNPMLAYAVGEHGVVLKSEDGAATWTQLAPTPPIADDLIDVHFLDPRWGWASGYKGAYRTQDGGATWSKLLTYDDHGAAHDALRPAQAVAFRDYEHGVVAVPGHVATTADGGTTWTKVAEAATAVAAVDGGLALLDRVLGFARLDGGVLAFQTPGVPGASYTTMKFFTPTTGWLLANARLYRTTDGGRTWAQLKTGMEDLFELDRLNCIAGTDGTHVWLASRDTILETRDGGTTWTRQRGPHHALSFELLDASHAVMLAQGEAWRLQP